MLFSSLTFLFVFLPLTLGLYYFSPRKFRNTILLILSILFYAWGGVSYGILFLGSIVMNYFLAARIQVAKNKKPWLVVGLTFNILIIAFFKYFNFLLENLAGLCNLSGLEIHYEPVKILLPIGISFYTFQQMSLLWDIYRSEEHHKIRFIDTSLYVSFFPQLIAGPIVRYKDIADQIRERKEGLELFTKGVERFITGLFKKVVIANACAEIADGVFSYSPEELSTASIWLGTFAYTLQIYFDFSGYSDMAIGLARMFGFELLENFNFPYVAKSIQDFWRRWHISLSTWFRDYVYIPLGGNRLGEVKTYRNLIIVFFLTGLWHGATWNFVIWGLFHGSFLIIERLGWGRFLGRAPSILGWLYVMLVVMIGWVFFRAETLDAAVSFIVRMFSNAEGSLDALYFLDTEKIIIIGLGTLLCLGTIPYLARKFHHVRLETPVITLLKQGVLLLLFYYSVTVLNAGSYNPFIYFNF